MVDKSGRKVRTILYHKAGKYQDNFTQDQDQINPCCSSFVSVDNIMGDQIYYLDQI